MVAEPPEQPQVATAIATDTSCQPGLPMDATKSTGANKSAPGLSDEAETTNVVDTTVSTTQTTSDANHDVDGADKADKHKDEDMLDSNRELLPSGSTEKHPAAKEWAPFVPKLTVDRTKVCPFLVKVHVGKGLHVSDVDFASERFQQRQKGIAIHCWMDTSLREIISLMSVHQPEIGLISNKIGFRQFRHTGRSIDQGKVPNFRRTSLEAKTLGEIRFVAGDALSMAILEDTIGARSMRSDGNVDTAPLRSTMRSDFRSGGRLNGRLGGRLGDPVERDTGRSRRNAPSQRYEPYQSNRYSSRHRN